MSNYLSHPSRCRGAVLLLVLGAVLILSILAVELAHRANLDVSFSSRHQRESAFRRAFDSGSEIAMSALHTGRNKDGFDCLRETWNRPVDFALSSDQNIHVQVSDESGKIRISSDTETSDSSEKLRKSLERMFACLRAMDAERVQEWETIEDLLLKRLGLDGKPEYGPLTTLDGLREAGISRSQVYRMNPADQKRIVLSDLLTTLGDGKINVNTAHRAVLYSLDEEFDENLVNQIVAWRRDHTASAEDEQQRPFRVPRDLEEVEGVVQTQLVNGHEQITKSLFLKVQDRVAVRGKAFSVQIHARVGGFSKLEVCYFDATPASSTDGRGTGIKLLSREEIEP